MADQNITVPDMDSAELFQSAMADDPPQKEEIAPELKAEVEKQLDRAIEEQPRDEQGRFVPKTEPEKPQEAKPEQEQAQPQQSDGRDDQSAQIPVWRARELTEARKAAEQRAIEADQQRYALQQEMQAMREQMAALQKPKAEPVDFFTDPEQALSQRLSPLEERFAQFEMRMRLNSSRALAIATHGKEQIAEMDNAIAKAMRENHPDLPYLRAQLQASDDPVGLAVQWYRRTKLEEITGGDPDAYRTKILDDAMKDPKFQAKVLEAARTQAGAAQSKDSRPNVQLPPSLNKALGSGGTQGADLSDADMSDAALFRHAMSGPRR